MKAFGLMAVAMVLSAIVACSGGPAPMMKCTGCNTECKSSDMCAKDKMCAKCDKCASGGMMKCGGCSTEGKMACDKAKLCGACIKKFGDAKCDDMMKCGGCAGSVKASAMCPKTGMCGDCAKKCAEMKK